MTALRTEAAALREALDKRDERLVRLSRENDALRAALIADGKRPPGKPIPKAGEECCVWTLANQIFVRQCDNKPFDAIGFVLGAKCANCGKVITESF